MNEYFSGTKPDLISMKSINDLIPYIDTNITNQIGNSINMAENFSTVINKGGNASNIVKEGFNIKNFFTNYIKPNLLPIIIILIFISCIIIRYLSINDRKNEEDKDNLIKMAKDANIDNGNSSDSHSSTIPKVEKFNPARSVKNQRNRNNYVEPTENDDGEYDDNLKVIYDMDDDLFNKITAKRDTPSSDLDNLQDINPDEYKYSDERDIINFGTNNWSNQPDGLHNPFYGNNYVSSTAEAVSFNKDLNKQYIDETAKKIFG